MHTYLSTHVLGYVPTDLGAIPFGLTTKVVFFFFFLFAFLLRPFSEDGYIKVNDQEHSATWLIDVPVHQPTCKF